ncbi:aspartyl/asparaginyl beta-hydroxylase domain-containing protein [Leptospira sp. 96542]|nr:aspartyl/asparaginyl beta-hydroxylase domain-containing protein [Leptospira sp. 96542]
MTFAALFAVLLLVTIPMVYVYRWRGRYRYTGVNQYVRKNWPIFAPLNCVLYLCTRKSARAAFVSEAELPTLKILRDNWQVFREEALALGACGAFEVACTPGTPASYDVGFRTFYKRGWSRFYLKWYGYNHPSAVAACPRSVELLRQVPDVKAAMFSILKPRSELSIHADPMASSLRYHLGLVTPNSESCFINVDGESRHWVDGQGFIFDETFMHYVRNDTDQPRLILMCDVTRPMNIFGRLFNRAYGVLARGMMTPNTETDGRGVFSAIFATVAPLIAAGRGMKSRKPRTYACLKWTMNVVLLAVLLGLIALPIWLLMRLF